MNQSDNTPTGGDVSRRNFLKNTGVLAAASALAGVTGCATAKKPVAAPPTSEVPVLPHVHAASNNTIQIALIGCGGRGGGAANNALSLSQCPIKLVAMADVFQDKLNGAYNALKTAHPNSVDVPDERKFIGFDGYKKAMDCLKPGDIAIFTTPLTFRWVHFTYAIEKGLNVFMEKPLTADGPASRRMLDLAAQASAKNLKVGVGLMSRHARPMQELKKRIDDGQLGDIILLRGYRMAGPLAACFSEKWNPATDPTELLWQISRFHGFIWASGGLYNDFYIHHIDHLCWMKGAWPVKAQALGGRHYRTSESGKIYVDQNFDSYSVEYTFGDGTKMYMDGRCINGCSDFYFSQAHGSKGMAVVAAGGDCNPPSSIHRGQNPTRENAIWTSKPIKGEEDPYKNEWDDLVDAIIRNEPYNEVPRGVQASVVSNMGRFAAHTGREVSYEQVLNHNIEYCPDADKLTMDSPSPLKADAEGRYAVPQPGILTDREY